MATRIAIPLVLVAALGLASCGGGSDGSGVVSPRQAQQVVVVEGVGGFQDVRYTPIGTLYIESAGRSVTVLERAYIGAIVVKSPAGVPGGGNQINLGRVAQVGRIEICNDGNVLYLFEGANGGAVTILGDDNTIYVEPAATLTVDDQGTGNVVVGL